MSMIMLAYNIYYQLKIDGRIDRVHSTGTNLCCCLDQDLLSWTDRSDAIRD
jgi:hypothetical protein